MKRLPVEICKYILNYLSLTEHKNLALVSHLFHDLAVCSLFSTINLYFPEDPRISQTDNLPFPLTSDIIPYTSQALRSWEILEWIFNNPAAPKLVKALRIHAIKIELAFETLPLAQALYKLPNLQAFAWFYTPLPTNVARALPPWLKHLSVSAFSDPSDIYHLSQLDELLLGESWPRTLFSMPFDFDLPFDDCVEGASEVIGMNSSLRKLSSLRGDIAELSIRVFENLTELEITMKMCTPFLGLDLLFRHASRLTSLSLRGAMKSGVLQSFEEFPDALPRLTSFCLWASDESLAPFWELSTRDCEIIVNFLRPKLLNRLFLHICCYANDFETLFVPLLSQMACLKALGLELTRKVVEAEDIPSFNNFLPSQLEALHVTWTGKPTGQSGCIHDVIEKLTGFCKLSFLSLGSSTEFIPYHEAADLAGHLPCVDTLLLDTQVFDIVRQGTEVSAIQWLPLKIEGCTAESLCGTNEAWLYKYRNWEYEWRQDL